MSYCASEKEKRILSGHTAPLTKTSTIQVPTNTTYSPFQRLWRKLVHSKVMTYVSFRRFCSSFGKCTSLRENTMKRASLRKGRPYIFYYIDTICLLHLCKIKINFYNKTSI